MTSRNKNDFFTRPTGRNAQNSIYTGSPYGTEVNMRSEFVNTMDGLFPEISKASIGILRKMRRDNEGQLIPCPCMDKVTGEGDRDRWCPICVKGDTYVATLHGERKIREIIPGEYVLAGDGQYHLVNDINGRLYRGNMVSLFANGRTNIPLELTADHKIFLYRPNRVCHQKHSFGKLCLPEKCISNSCRNRNLELSEFPILELRADEVKVGDFVLCPRSSDASSVVEKKEKLVIDWKKYFAKKGFFPFTPSTEIEIDEDLMYFLGFYVAEGSGDAPSRKSRGVCFSLHEREKEVAEKLLSIASSKFGLNGSIEKSKKKGSKSIAVIIHSAVLSRWLHEICGRYSDYKKTPNFIWELDSRLQKEYLNAFLAGDGHLDKENRESSGITSRQLAEEIYILALLNGYFPSIRFKESYVSKEGQKHSDSWYIQWLVSAEGEGKDCPTYWRERFATSDYLFMKVKKIEIKEEICAVYDISVDSVHSFVGNGILVHNCFSANYLNDEVFVQYYRTIAGLDTSNALRDKHTQPGLINIPVIVFYIRYDALITRQDEIVEILRDDIGEPVQPLQRTAVYQLGTLWDYRSDNGKLEYYKAFAHEATVKYINAPFYKDI
jgi:hypothetical protein